MRYVIQITPKRTRVPFDDFLQHFLINIQTAVDRVIRQKKGCPKQDAIIIVSHEYLYGSDNEYQMVKRCKGPPAQIDQALENSWGLDESQARTFEEALQEKINALAVGASNIVIMPGTVVLKSEKQFVNRAYFFTPQNECEFTDKSNPAGFKFFDWHGVKVSISICCQWNKLVGNSTVVDADIYFVPTQGQPLLSESRPHQLRQPKPGALYIGSDRLFRVFEVLQIVSTPPALISLAFDQEELSGLRGTIISNRAPQFFQCSIPNIKTWTDLAKTGLHDEFMQVIPVASIGGKKDSDSLFLIDSGDACFWNFSAIKNSKDNPKECLPTVSC